MITKFTVGNFLSFKDKQTLSFIAKKQDTNLQEALSRVGGKTLVRVIAVYGANASGKSNLTKAFAFVRNFVIEGLKQLESPVPVEPFLLSNDTENKPSYFELEIVADKNLFKYGFEISSKKVHREWLYQYPNKKVLFERNLDEIKSNRKHFKEGSAVTKKQTKERKNVLFLSVVASYGGPVSTRILNAVKKIQVISESGRGQTLDYSFDKYRKDENYRERMKEFLLEADLGIDDIISEEQQITAEEFVKTVPPPLRDQLVTGKGTFLKRKLEFLHKKLDSQGKSVGTVPFNFFQESDGTRQMFALSAPFINTLEESNTLIVDELDSSLHPLMCRYLLKVFNSSEQNPNNAQLVFTTHDISLLDEDLLRRDQVWFTQKDRCGTSELFSLMDLKERSNLNFAKRYLEGRYGALPYIKKLENID